MHDWNLAHSYDQKLSRERLFTQEHHSRDIFVWKKRKNDEAVCE